MDILNKLTLKNLKLNKKRTIVTIIGIILSVALITAVATMYMSAVASLIDYEIYQKGDFHVAFYDVDSEELEKFDQNIKIEKINVTKHLGYALLEGVENEYKPYAHVMAFTSSALEDLSIKLVEGRLPENDGEILIPTHLKTNGRIVLNVGDEITLAVGDRVRDGEILGQSNPFVVDSAEEIVGATMKTYKVVGIIERPATNIESYTAPGYTFITHMSDDEITGSVDVYARFTEDGTKDPYRLTASIIGVDQDIFDKFYNNKIYTEEEWKKYSQEIANAKYSININTYLIMLETNPLEDGAAGGLMVVAGIVCLIIVFTSVFCIKNSFDISITEKIKQYGMLRSVGATKKQIKKNVFYEASVLGAIGIPIGLLSGVFASYILVIVSNYLLDDNLAAGLVLRLEISWIAIAFAIILGIITIYLSSLRSARKASKISPIDSIRNSQNIKIKASKIKSPRFVKAVFGIGGDISYKNLKRNKSKYRTTIISIIVSVATFIALSSFVDLAFSTVDNELTRMDYNLTLSAYVDGDEKFYDALLKTSELDNIEAYTVLKEDGVFIASSNYSEEYIKTAKRKLDENIYAYLTIYAVGEESYRDYLKKIGLDYEDAKDKAILIDTVKLGIFDDDTENIKYVSLREFAYSKGDVIKGDLGSDQSLNISLEVVSIEEDVPFGLSAVDYPMIIVSDEMFESFNKEKDPVNILYKASDADSLQDDIEEMLKSYDYNLNNIDEYAKMMDDLFTLVAIFLYGFIIVVSLIGVTNIFNTITTNMELRKQEFAMLKSVGMTKREFYHMIRLESVFIGLKSLVFGIPIGVALSYLIYNFLGKDAGLSYPVPYMGIVISIVVVFILISLIMNYSIGKINKQNTIETIRNENI